MEISSDVEVQEAKACLPHVFQPVDRQEIGGHGEVQLVDEGGHLGGRIQQVDDGAAELAQFGLEGNEHLRAHVGTGGATARPQETRTPIANSG